jgi:predicted methyltransferase
MVSSLINMIAWSHHLAVENLRPGDLAVDLTAGKGRDTVVLAESVGSEGQVVALDVQEMALQKTAETLASHGFIATPLGSEDIIPDQSGIFLVQACHSVLSNILVRAPKVILANLGYLPGGDRKIITKPETTFLAIQQSLQLLEPGGRLVVTVYPKHRGGAEESSVVRSCFEKLDRRSWHIACITVANCLDAPFLFAVERR